jgi:hypothetical protein
MTQTQVSAMNQSRLVTLKTGQIVGYPLTRRELKRQLRQARLQRRAEFRRERKAQR